MEFSVDLISQGNKKEITSLIENNSEQIYRLAIKMLNNQQDAEDVLQNTFLKALQNIHQFEGRSKLSTWLFRIASNEALMVLRKKANLVDINDKDEIEPTNGLIPSHLIDWCCLPEEEMINSESKRMMDQAIAHLSDKLRIVFILRDIEGFSILETCEILGLTETTVKTRLLRARAALRHELSDYYTEQIKRKRS